MRDLLTEYSAEEVPRKEVVELDAIVMRNANVVVPKGRPNVSPAFRKT